jgi:CubicO group peptidase (beta-lactamase class C family)
MPTGKQVFPLLAVLFAAFRAAAIAQTIPNGAAIDAEVGRIMTQTHAKGMAVAVIDHGKVGYVNAYGDRDAKGDPLTKETVMYGASLTKTVFAYIVMQLVDQGKLNLDTPIEDDLDKPLPSYGPDPVFPDKYGPYKDLADDPRWEKITPRMCLTHSTGFSNFWFIEPDQKLHIHFEPGTRFSYSGEGFILLQFVIEHGRKAQGLGLDVGDLAKADFDRLGMARTSLVWLNDNPEPNVADGWNDEGQPQPHDKRSKVRVAGSMNTTISDLSKFAAALVRGDGLSAASRAEISKPSPAYDNGTPVSPFSARRTAQRAAQGFVLGPGRHRLRRTAGPRLLQGRPRRPDGQHPGLHRVQPAMRRYPLKRRSLRGRLRRSGETSSSATPACPMTGNMATTPGKS